MTPDSASQDAGPEATADAEPHLITNSPIDVRSASLAVLAVLASVVVLHWARAVFVPLLLGVMFSYALTPIVTRMVAMHIPRALAAALLLTGLLGGVAATVYSLSDDAASLIETLPDVAHKLRRGMQGTGNSEGAIDRVQAAAAELERAADEHAGPAPQQRATKVQIEPARFNLRDYLWPGVMGLVAAIGQGIVVLFITFFLLVAGDTFRRKMVKIAGPTFGQKRLTLQALDEIDQQIQRYLLLQVFTSTVVGIATGLVFLWIGVEHAAVWGVVAFVLDFVPYFGSIAITIGAAVMGFAQFGSIQQALLIAGAALFIHAFEAYIVTPWLTRRASRMNPAAIFVGVLAWGWLWGPWGLFLGVPILMVIKTVCDRVVDLKPIGELLGE